MPKTLKSSVTASLSSPLSPSDDTPLSSVNCLLVDVQTTGASPRSGSLIEMSWGLLRYRSSVNEELEGEIRCQSDREGLGDYEDKDKGGVRGLKSLLVRPPRGAKLSRVISEMTGIKRAQLKGASAPEKAAKALWQTLLEVSSEAESEVPWVWVAHLARFERSFIIPLLRAHPPPGLDEAQRDQVLEGLPWVCTHALSLRRLPTAPRRSIAAMSALFDGPRLKLKRAQPHVIATAYIWRGLSELSREEGLCTWRSLKEDLESPSRRLPFQAPLARERRLSAPQTPGVYHLLDQRGVTIYVGVAKDLKRRINQHFQGRKHHDEHHLELITLVRDVRWESTASHLEALILENREIKRLSPHYNRALTQTEAPLYLELDRGDLTQRDHRLSGDEICWGPWVDSRLLEQLVVLNAVSRGDFSLIHRGWPLADVESWRALAQSLRDLSLSHESLPLTSEHLTWRWWKRLTQLLRAQRVNLKSSDEDEELLRDHERPHESADSTIALELELILMSRLEPRGALTERLVKLMIQLTRASILTEQISLYGSGELCWYAERGGGLRGWRSIALGSSQPLQSEHLSGPPREAIPLNSGDQKLLARSYLSSRLEYDEARLVTRFVGRALTRGERVYWRQPNGAYHLVTIAEV